MANLGLVLATAALGSTGALIGLNMAQNGPERALNLDTIVGGKELTGDLFSGPFTPTDTAPTCLNEVLTLRCKSDVVRAWRNGKAPTSVPGGAEGGAVELWDGALLRRGVLKLAYANTGCESRSVVAARPTRAAGFAVDDARGEQIHDDEGRLVGRNGEAYLGASEGLVQKV